MVMFQLVTETLKVQGVNCRHPHAVGPVPGFQGGSSRLPGLGFTYDLLIPKMILHLYPKANITKASIQK